MPVKKHPPKKPAVPKALQTLQHAPIAIKPDNPMDAIQEVVNRDLEKKHGVGILKRIGDTLPDMPKIATGLATLDVATNGGIPIGIVHIYGLAGCGKSSLALQIAGQYESVVYLDAEHKVTGEMARMFGIHGFFELQQIPITLEVAFDIAEAKIKAGIQLVALDSLPSFKTIAQAENKKAYTGKPEQVAGIAQFLSRRLPVLNDLCWKYHATVIIVNQLRDNMNLVNPYAERYHTPGGHQLKGLAKLSILCAKNSDIKIDEKAGNKKEKVVIGHTLAFRIDKNSSGPAKRMCGVSLLYGQGFVQDAQGDTVVVEEDESESEE